MARRKRIGLIFCVNPNWMGGTHYVLNIINTLNYLPDEEKPQIFLVSNPTDFQFAKNYVDYPYLYQAKVTYNLIKRIINKIIRGITKKNLLSIIPVVKENLDVIFPVMNIKQFKSRGVKKYWIPDFQEKYLPFFFEDEEIKSRDTIIKQIIEKKGALVFSSYDALESFKIFYPEGYQGNENIYRFVVTLPNTKNLDRSKILSDLKLETPFFYCANQFWVHKNHKTLFEAVKILKDHGINILLICSGAPFDYRNPEYFKEISDFIDENKLRDNIRILGFIDRSTQLCLMEQCEAMIQPSLFEGWSTSVEEAKALNKFLILSDLNVHKEQAKENSLFFNRNSAQDLANKIELFLQNKPTIKIIDYQEKIVEAAYNLLKILN